MIETGEIKMPPKKLLSILFFQKGIIWLIIALTGVALFIILGITLDPRFYVLTLIWIFLFFPLIIAFLYFFYGMEPLTAFNSIPHKLIFSKDAIKVRLIRKEESGENEIENNNYYTVDKSSFSGMKTGADFVLLQFNKSGWLYLPVSSLSSLNDFKKIIGIFQDKSL